MSETYLTATLVLLAPFVLIAGISAAQLRSLRGKVQKHMAERRSKPHDRKTRERRSRVNPLRLLNHPPSEHERPPAQQTLTARAGRLRSGAATVSLLCSLAAAAVLAWGDLSIAGTAEPQAVRLLANLWPVTIVALILLVFSYQAKCALLLAAYVALAAGGWRISGDPWAFAGLTFAPTLVLLLTVSRRYKSIAPLTTLVMLIVVASLSIAVGAGSAFGDFVVAVIVGLITFAITLAIGLLLVRRLVVKRYRLKKFSDRSFHLTFIWCVFCVNWIVTRGGQQWYAGLLAFAVYWVATSILQRPLRLSTQWKNPANLLVLRTFRTPENAQRLFDELAARWRSAGPVFVIAGTDSAEVNLDLDEAWHFINRQFDDLFVHDENRQKRLDALDERPDPDGRFRVVDFFCYLDTWQETFHRLLERSHAVLVDASGFTAKNEGLVYELGYLLERKPLASIVIITDDTTNEADLHETLQDQWAHVPDRSRNAGDDRAAVRILHKPSPRDVMTSLRYAAVAGDWKPQEAMSGAVEASAT